MSAEGLNPLADMQATLATLNVQHAVLSEVVTDLTSVVAAAAEAAVARGELALAEQLLDGLGAASEKIRGLAALTRTD